MQQQLYQPNCPKENRQIPKADEEDPCCKHSMEDTFVIFLNIG